MAFMHTACRSAPATPQASPWGAAAHIAMDRNWVMAERLGLIEVR